MIQIPFPSMLRIIEIRAGPEGQSLWGPSICTRYKDTCSINAVEFKCRIEELNTMQKTCIRNPLTGKMTSVLNGNWFEYIVQVRTLPRVSYCAKIAIVVKTKLNRRLNVKTAWNTVTMRAIAKTTNDAKCARKLVVSPVRKNASNTRKIVRISLLSMVIKICCQIFIPLTLTVEIINLQSTRSS